MRRKDEPKPNLLEKMTINPEYSMMGLKISGPLINYSEASKLSAEDFKEFYREYLDWEWERRGYNKNNLPVSEVSGEPITNPQNMVIYFGHVLNKADFQQIYEGFIEGITRRDKLANEVMINFYDKVEKTNFFEGPTESVE